MLTEAPGPNLGRSWQHGVSRELAQHLLPGPAAALPWGAGGAGKAPLSACWAGASPTPFGHSPSPALLTTVFWGI